jgi:hypothetical protein
VKQIVGHSAAVHNLADTTDLRDVRMMQGAGWVRCGSCVAYGANSIVCRKKQAYYTLTFTVEFPYDQDLVHLAHCYPFTWTDQQTHIHVLKQVRSARIRCAA